MYLLSDENLDVLQFNTFIHFLSYSFKMIDNIQVIYRSNVYIKICIPTILLRKVQENKSIKCSDTNLVFKIFKIWLCTFKVYNSLRVIFHQPKFYVSLIFSFYIIITKAEIYMLQRKKEVFILFYSLCFLF